MRRVSAEEFLQWFDEHEPFPKPDEDMIREMEKEGMLFEIHEHENGWEYPQINSVNWGKNVNGPEES